MLNGDIIIFNTSDYSDYFTSNQSSCSSNIVTCNIDGSLTVINQNNLDLNLKLTQFTLQIRNPPYVGNANFAFIIYDNTKTYLKQKGNFIVTVSTTNPLSSSSINYTSSNPYFN